MQNLFLLRHAHSNSSLNDFERTLNHEGIKKCEYLANILQNHDIDYIFSSDSERTKETVENILPKLKHKPEIHYIHDLYCTSAEELFEFIENNKHDNMLLVNHNPAISQLALLLSNFSSNKALHEELNRGFAPGSLAHFQDRDLVSFWR